MLLRRQWMRFLAVLLGLGSQAALAGALSDDQAAELFCSNSVQAICGPDGEFARLYDAEAEDARNQIRQKALEALAREYGFAPDDQGYDSYKAAHPADASQLQDDFLAQVRAGALAELGDGDGPEIRRTAGRVREHIETRLSQLLPRDKAQGIQTELGAFEVVPVAEIIQKGPSHELWPNFLRNCSLPYNSRNGNGLKDNAFQPPETHKFVVCPGALLAARTDKSKRVDQQDLFGGLNWTVAHEMGHTIDSDAHPEIFSSMRACVDTKLAMTRELKGFVGLVPATPEWGVTLNGYMAEISADYWANEVLAELAEAEEQAHGKAAAMRLVRRALVGNCGASDSGVHPSERVRLGMLVGGHHGLRRVFGCASAPDKGCRL